MARRFSEHATFLSPAVAIAIAITLPPVIFIFYTSVQGPSLSFAAFTGLLDGSIFARTLANTFVVAGLASFTSLILGFIVALHLARQSPRRRAVMVILVLLPFWTSVLVKCFAFTVILGREGIINAALSWIFNTRIELPLILNRIGLLVGMTNFLVPMIALPVLASLLAIDQAVYRAASIMGAKPGRIFWTVTLPMSLPGVIAGLVSVFVMSLGAFQVPALLGGPQERMLSNLVDFYNRQLLDWPKASAISIVLLAIVLAIGTPLMIYRRQFARSQHE